MLKRRPRILGLLFAIATATGLSLAAAPASYASAPMGPYLIEPTDSMCVQTTPANAGADIQFMEEWHQPGTLRSLGIGNYHIQNYGNGPCIRATASKDNSAVWA